MIKDSREFIPLPTVEKIFHVLEKGVSWIIADIEALPIHDQRKIRDALNGTHLVEALVVPEVFSYGLMPQAPFVKGKVAILSRSKSLAAEAVFQTTAKGVGQSVCVVTKGPLEPLIALLEEDLETESLILIGEAPKVPPSKPFVRWIV